MKKIIASLLIAALTMACSPTETQEAKDVPTVEELASDADQLMELRQKCRTDRSTLGDVLCNRVAEATNRRFIGDGTVPYTPSKDPPRF